MAKAKEIAGIDCAGEAGAGIRLTLAARLAEMSALREAALDWTDIEGVHDMRVASRRLRSALRDFTPYTRKRRLSEARDELKRIADALGVVRDEDVAIVALEKLATNAPDEIRSGIEGFAQAHAERREAARERLREAITEEKLESLQAEFEHALARATKPARRGRKSKELDAVPVEKSLRDVGREIITSRFDELRALSASLYRPHEVEGLHRLRIAAKRLRYAVELFAPCWRDSISSFESEIGKLQTSLGELHDCDVWIEAFGAQLSADRHTEEHQAEKEHDDAEGDAADHVHHAPAATRRRAATWLLDYFVKARTRHFRDALARWQEWESTDFATRLESALEIAPAAEASVIVVEITPANLTAAEAVSLDIETREKNSTDTSEMTSPDMPE